MKRVLLALACLAGCGDGRPSLHVLAWPDYFAPDTIARFEKETGAKVVVDYIDSSETLRAKIAGGKSGYDVVFSSDEAVPSLVAAGLLDRLDPLPGRKHIAPEFRGLAYDPEGAYTVPYMFGTTGLAWRKDAISPAPDSWAALWTHSKKATLLADGREVIAAAMRLDGSSALTAETVAKAGKRFHGWKPLAWQSAPKDMLVNGDAHIAQCYSGDALQAAEATGGKVGFVIPKEGGTLWVDNLCIPKGAPQRALAHRFIDYLLRPDVSSAITKATRFGNPNAAARALLPLELLGNPLVFPPPDVRARLTDLPPLTPELKKVVDAAWASIQ
ncbi:MAG TPA: spermidine/putrescine ABC transporter substrate-binding protein, partial [Planctomycetota bacterium]|nr:spermidine/putrescine ABC transporter substrate-binding protein [Planctomycetota bacterium]